MRPTTPPPRLIKLASVLLHLRDGDAVVTVADAELLELTGYALRTFWLALEEAVTLGALTYERPSIGHMAITINDDSTLWQIAKLVTVTL